MARRIREYPWEQTELGPLSGWSDSLQMALQLCLGSRMCSCIYWGQHFRVIYNDAYASILGDKHPWALGLAVDEVWPEILDVIGPLMKRTLSSGDTTGGDDIPLFLNRAGYVEEFYCSFSYTPIFDQSGEIEGVLATLPETSVRVIGERRLRTLQKLGVEAREARSPEQMLQIAAKTFAQNRCDLPFAALYLWREDDAQARLVASAGLSAGDPLSPERIELDGDDRLAELVRRARAEKIVAFGLGPDARPVPLGAWKTPACEAMMISLEPYRDERLNAAMVVGISPHKRLDDEHMGFFRMLTHQMERSLAEAGTHEQEMSRIHDLERRARMEQAAERVRIARDLHDTLLQNMQGLRFLLEVGIERSRRNDPSALEMLQASLDSATQAISEGRQVLSLLRSTSRSVKDIGATLSAMLEEILGGVGVAWDLQSEGSPWPVPPETGHEVLSICREALSNAARHARASCVRVRVAFSSELEIEIRDDGVGVEAGILQTGRSGHFGIPGMKERARVIGATIRLESALSEGCYVSIRVPRAPEDCAP